MLTEIPSEELICFGIILSALSILTLLGNSLVCLAVWRLRNLRSLTNYLVCSLAYADFLVPILRVIYINISVYAGKWVFGITWCYISSMCGVLLCSASILHLCAISIERLIAIKWPLSYDAKVTPKRIVIVLIYIWVQSLVFSIFPTFGLAEHRFNPVLAECEINWLKKPALTVLLLVFYFFLPVTVMLIAYAIIYKEVRRNSRRISALESAGNQGSRSNVLKREMKAVKTLAVVVGMFFIMWMPYFVTTTIRAFRGDDAIPGALQRTVITLAYGNSCCNFVIYALMNAQLRNAFYRILKECCGTREARIDLNSTRGLNLTTVSRNRRAEAPMESKEKYRRD
ncbi:D(2) dopamine receptor-like [Stylophora pistillata]|uniref:Histamine H2 receptor n=1 Tax=Stylophora pistillata TaxID=50429 RepID=A0A2B4S7K2_STYPI|nr:D(2) dopamine receptor-like [Stylophora pistillata]XP_022792568.1 D(2) dopamine receptor-like [Stylophora pistillata]XP_022792569.1 D(2) dopamine receptor-like [Stylophora pistillata]XP_022792570.1 D(2) dopamine receptor-like [Stylophora pistillata]PFX24435.1 Histamine H2 receptor [Stylophora pistillata]